MTETLHDFRAILERMIALGASDLHVKVGQPPTLRIDGVLFGLDLPSCRPTDVERLLGYVLTDEQRAIFDKERELNLAVSLSGLARFRVNLCRQRGTVGMSFRLVPTRIPSLEELALPPRLGELIREPRGLVLITGATGVGKSTTLAAMLDHLNHTESRKIVTIEDPIEYLHKDDRCLIYQREVGADTRSLSAALRQVLRQDPDVIALGEIREAETLTVALTAANTNHLVLVTLHTLDAEQSIQHIVSHYAPHQQDEIRHLLADNLLAAVSQRLVPKLGGRGRVPALEIVTNTPIVREHILDPAKTSLTRKRIQEDAPRGASQSLDQSLAGLVRSGLVTIEDAMRFATRPDELSQHLQRIDESFGRILAGIRMSTGEETVRIARPEWMRP